MATCHFFSPQLPKAHVPVVCLYNQCSPWDEAENTSLTIILPSASSFVGSVPVCNRLSLNFKGNYSKRVTVLMHLLSPGTHTEFLWHLVGTPCRYPRFTWRCIRTATDSANKTNTDFTESNTLVSWPFKLSGQKTGKERRTWTEQEKYQKTKKQAKREKKKRESCSLSNSLSLYHVLQFLWVQAFMILIFTYF